LIVGKSLVVRRLVLLAVALTVLLTAGCGTFPADPEDTLQRVTGGILRVGVSPNPPHTEVRGPADPEGSEVVLVRDFAASLPAEIQWTVGGEEMLILALENGDLDLVIGGLTADTPWTKHAAITKPYAEATDPAGEPVKLVMAARLGENAFLLRLERFLRERGSL
jgi:polar amino acid transport system substrate-binding protein